MTGHSERLGTRRPGSARGLLAPDPSSVPTPRPGPGGAAASESGVVRGQRRHGPWQAYGERVRRLATRPQAHTDDDAVVRQVWERKALGAAVGACWVPLALAVALLLGQWGSSEAAPQSLGTSQPAPPPGGTLGLLLAAGALTSLAGFLLPDLAMSRQWAHERRRIRRALPGSVDLISLCTRAGLTLETSIERVASAAPPTDPLARQWRRVVADVRLGQRRGSALSAMAERVGLAELTSAISALNQSEGLGAPLSATLRTQSRAIRDHIRFAAEESAQRVQVKILFPLICCLLPALFLVVVGPGALRIVEVMRMG